VSITSPSAEVSRKGHTTFRPRARLLRILGEELISDEVVAITELVKNAYDADATCVSISFEGVAGPAGRIVVRDDGDGMDLDTILHRWMEPASSGKGRKGVRRTRRGRRMLGEKGVGRFAVDKLAARLELMTRSRGQKEELRVLFDWDEYLDDSRMLSDVKSHWEQRKPQTFERHGTALIMTGLRCEWTERTFRRLCTRLSRLISPHERDSSFRIEIRSDEFPDYSGVLNGQFLDRAPYVVDAVFDGSGSISIKVNGKPSVMHTWNGRDELACGPVMVRIHGFDLETEALARIGQRTEVRSWLRHWSGVSIYRDGFRIWPYGEPHDDWLRLDQRRVNNPTMRLSNNQIVGAVHISADGNPKLRDQTNREGLINNRALEDVRRLLYFVLQLLEAERQTIRNPRERRSRVRAPIDGEHPVSTELDELARNSSGRIAGRIKAISKRARDTAERAAAGQRLIVEGLVELAAAGQAAAGLHEMTAPLLDGMEMRIRSLRKRGETGVAPESLLALQQDLENLKLRLAMIAPISEAITSRRHSMDVAEELGAFRELLRPVLESCETSMDLAVPKSGALRAHMRPQTFHRLLHALTANSLDWMDDSRPRRIRVELQSKGSTCQIRFSDTGQGVQGEFADKIFEPLFSLKEGGKGMGLTIARSLIEQHGGEIFLENNRRRSGATFVLQLPLRRARPRQP
jgi:signal transduction histidine kinase